MGSKSELRRAQARYLGLGAIAAIVPFALIFTRAIPVAVLVLAVISLVFRARIRRLRREVNDARLKVIDEEFEQRFPAFPQTN